MNLELRRTEYFLSPSRKRDGLPCKEEPVLAHWILWKTHGEMPYYPPCLHSQNHHQPAAPTNLAAPHKYKREREPEKKGRGKAQLNPARLLTVSQLWAKQSVTGLGTNSRMLCAGAKTATLSNAWITSQTSSTSSQLAFAF